MCESNIETWKETRQALCRAKYTFCDTSPGRSTRHAAAKSRGDKKTPEKTYGKLISLDRLLSTKAMCESTRDFVASGTGRHTLAELRVLTAVFFHTRLSVKERQGESSTVFRRTTFPHRLDPLRTFAVCCGGFPSQPKAACNPPLQSSISASEFRSPELVTKRLT